MLLRTRDSVKKRKVVIVGAGPAGSSLAIRLARAGSDVVLIERERFPRPKLCGEFISPECLRHFEQLGAYPAMRASGGARILETRFYDRKERSITVPSKWFHSGANALSLSRLRMDECLLDAAKTEGVEVHEDTAAIRVAVENEHLAELVVRGEAGERSIEGDIFIDATGRASVLAKLLAKASRKGKPNLAKPPYVAFKGHLAADNLGRDVCEIYSFDGGYGGLSPVEHGLANLCFIVKSTVARAFGGDAERLMSDVVCRNPRASFILREAAVESEWLAVAIEGFGRNVLRPALNVFAIGDAGGFIDPFTGSGILMALESSEILAACISDSPIDLNALEKAYERKYKERFGRRLKLCSILRSAAFHPNIASAAISLLGVSKNAREYLAKRTRGEYIGEN
ncbi:MAG TPA: NAD(P)/FAD-dependent oxidoreductase [Pyrinomonadaceae bacterium]|jgi:flavin-dependent dehydrogenase|nr:NAD(P)/FAD-dependent oxidoreductase [Pyrinomonadaceae bacterium]